MIVRSLRGLALISRQSSLSCENKFLAHLWKDLVFTEAGASVDLGDPFSQGGDLRANLGGVVRVGGESDIGLQVFQRLVSRTDSPQNQIRPVKLECNTKPVKEIKTKETVRSQCRRQVKDTGF